MVKTDFKRVANRNIAILFYDTEGITELPKMIQSHLKHCIHSLVKDVCSEQEPYQGKVRTPIEWASRQTAHTLGDIEEVGYELSETVHKAIKSTMYRTAEEASVVYERSKQMEGEEDER